MPICSGSLGARAQPWEPHDHHFRLEYDHSVPNTRKQSSFSYMYCKVAIHCTRRVTVSCWYIYFTQRARAGKQEVRRISEAKRNEPPPPRGPEASTSLSDLDTPLPERFKRKLHCKEFEASLRRLPSSYWARGALGCSKPDKIRNRAAKARKAT